MGLIVAVAVLAVALALRDIYARRRERELATQIAALQKQVTHTDRIANVGRLVSGLAQDLKSPLQGVLGNAELLVVADSTTGGRTEEVQDIHANATRAVGIVRNMLAFTETHALNRRWHDLNDIVKRAVEEKRLDGSYADRVTLDMPRLPLVYIDGRQVVKVIVTILDHTSRHGDPGRGKVAIATSRGAASDDRLTVDIDDATLALPDDSPEWAGELTACRRVLEAHGGSFDVERRPQAGLRFHLELPITEHPEAQRL